MPTLKRPDDRSRDGGMGIVVVLDQRRSRCGPDRVEEVQSHLNTGLGHSLVRGFVRTAGDEMQAVIRDPQALNPIVEYCLRSGEWWLGIGIGVIDSLGRTSRDSRGPAFLAAREAVELAKRRRRWPVAVKADGGDRAVAERLQGMCDVMAFVATRRSARQWEAIDAARGAGSGSGAAAALAVTPQAANELLRVAGFREQGVLEAEIRGLAGETLAHLDA